MKSLVNSILARLPISGRHNSIRDPFVFARIIRGNLCVHGNNNTVDIKTTGFSKAVKIYIFGNNNHLFISDNVIYKAGSVWLEDSNNAIRIGELTTIEEANISVAESTMITIGKDCMFSTGIRIASSDAHSIVVDGKRTNHAKNIVIGNHVWIAMNSTINKGVEIGENSIVSGHSVVTKCVPPNSIMGGVPARVLKENCNWNRKRI